MVYSRKLARYNDSMIKLNENFAERVSPLINFVAQYVSADALEMCSDNEEFMEIVLQNRDWAWADGDNGLMDGRDLCDLIMDAIQDNGYSNVVKFLSKNFNYV